MVGGSGVNVSVAVGGGVVGLGVGVGKGCRNRCKSLRRDFHQSRQFTLNLRRRLATRANKEYDYKQHCAVAAEECNVQRPVPGLRIVACLL